MPHTPRNWVTRGTQRWSDGQDRCVVGPQEGGYTICECLGPDRDVNARIIAAAPTLLAACKEAAEWLETRSKHYLALGSEDMAKGLWDHAYALREAIRAAEQGESS